LDLLKPDTTEPPPAVRFVPAPFLFVHTEPLPEGMQPSELQSFAEVTMETLAPMPLEQLSWGYLSSERATHLLLFAAARERLEKEELLPEDSFFHVLPSFFAAAPADASAHWVFIWEAGYLTGLHYDAESTVPSRVELEQLIEDNPAGAFAARDRLLKRLGSASRIEAAAGILTRPESLLGPRERLAFFFAHYTAPDAEPSRIEGRPPANPAARWTADLRDGLFRAKEQQRRQTLRLLNRTLQVAAGFAIVLLALQIVWAAGTIWVKTRNSIIARQQPVVDSVEQNQLLLSKIDEFSSHQLRPFEMMAALNDLRPHGIVYKSAKAANGNELIAQCTAPDPSTMNDFLDAIAKSQLADVVGDPHTVLNPRGVSFDLDVKFRQPLSPEPMPPDQPTEAPAAQPSGVAQAQFPPGFRSGPQILGGPNQPNEGPTVEVNGQPQPGEPPPAPAGPAVYLN
jgi:hypothetical protein